MPKVLLSFIGRNKYERCVYVNPQTQEQSPVVRFVTEAICVLNCQNWTENDRIFIFLTPDARTANWLGKAYENDPDDTLGLKERLNNLGLKAKIEPIEIKEGFDETEIWANFQTIFDCINERDAIYLDITNAFRSIPIFATTLMNYTEFLKKGVNLKAIYYGIFEKLGPVYEVVKKYPNPADRLVPILDLKSIVELQDWTSAANDFLQHGNATALAKQAEMAKFPSSREFAVNLNALTGAFSTVRGKKMTTGLVFSDLRQNIQDIERDAPRPLKPILEKINAELQPFQSDDILNGFRAIEWCLNHKLYQQGITLMREAIVSYIGHKLGLDFSNKNERAIVEKAFTIQLQKLPPHPTPQIVQKALRQFTPPRGLSAEDFVNGITLVCRNPTFRALHPIYTEISYEYRNDINHGGYMSDAKESDEFVLILFRKYDELKKIIAF
ncbi:MAG: TIGR02221 family CRISPR-associated protein [Saprospiraceae bacterium]|nr:TIGR02221 family CRISPR-associated protein [Saprospiraceae bacterium]